LKLHGENAGELGSVRAKGHADFHVTQGWHGQITCQGALVVGFVLWGSAARQVWAEEWLSSSRAFLTHLPLSLGALALIPLILSVFSGRNNRFPFRLAVGYVFLFWQAWLAVSIRTSFSRAFPLPEPRLGRLS
jgi:hypothetical protein